MYLNFKQVAELVQHNQYIINEDQRLISRDFSGRLGESETKTLPVISSPGGDLGELAIVYAAANEFGFDVNSNLVLETLSEIVGGLTKFSYSSNPPALYGKSAECTTFLDLLRLSPFEYHLQTKDLEVLQTQLKEIKHAKSSHTRVGSYYMESAVLVVRGDKGIMPIYEFKEEDRSVTTSVYVYQQTLNSDRRRLLAKRLYAKKAVNLYPGCDSEYLYEVMSEIAESHFYITLRLLAPQLPIYLVTIDKKGIIGVENLSSL